MAYKNACDRTSSKREWKYVNRHAIALLRIRAEERGENPKLIKNEKSVSPEVAAAARVEIRQLIADGKIPPVPVQTAVMPTTPGKARPFPKKPPKLPRDPLTVSLEDPNQMPPDLKWFGHPLLMTFFAELQVLGDVQIIALKNGLPLHVILRRCQEGEVDTREDRHTWNAALYRKVAQCRAHVMAEDLVKLKALTRRLDPDKVPIPHNIQLRATDTHARFTFPERFLPSKSMPDVLFSPRMGVQVNNNPAPSTPGPNSANTDPKSAIGSQVLVAPSQDDLDDMSDISLVELQAAITALEQGKLE